MLAYQQQEATPGAMYITMYPSFLSKVQCNLTSQLGIFTKAPFHQIHAHMFFASLNNLHRVFYAHSSTAMGFSASTALDFSPPTLPCLD